MVSTRVTTKTATSIATSVIFQLPASTEAMNPTVSTPSPKVQADFCAEVRAALPFPVDSMAVAQMSRSWLPALRSRPNLRQRNDSGRAA